jgi:alkyl hydroperoxide reductase subunit AhpC
MKIIYLILILHLSLISSSKTETINFATKIAGPYDMFSDLKIEISGPYDMFEDETWKILGACSNTPNLTVEIAGPYDMFADKKIKIADKYDMFVDKTTCITNADDLDQETLRLLKLID